MPTSRRTFLQCAALAAAACDSTEDTDLENALRSATPESLNQAPDVVFVCIDDLNDWPSPFEGPKPTIDPNDIHTPNMELLAQFGTVFQRAYCAAPICGASRSATLTGLPPHVSGVAEHENILDPVKAFGPLLVSKFSTLPALFQKAGYTTCGSGKVFHGGGYNDDTEAWKYAAAAWDGYGIFDTSAGRPKTFQYVTGPQVDAKVRPCPNNGEPLPDAKVAAFAVDKLLEPYDGSPLFLAVGFFKPHAPWEAPESYYSMYPTELIKSLDPFVERLDQADLTLSGCTSLRDLQSSPVDKHWDERTRAAIAAYLACVTHTDHLLGEIILATAQRKRRTIFVLWSDHGYFMGEKHGWKKPKLYERASRVPLIIVDTAQLKKQSTHKIVSLNDLYPTVLDYAGIAPPTSYGVSLRPLVEDASASWSQTSVVSTFNFRGHHKLNDPDLDRCMKARGITRCGQIAKPVCPSYGVRMQGASHALRTERPGEQYRYIRYHESELFTSKNSIAHRELYDLSNDPAERTNLLAPEFASKSIQTLASKLDAELTEKLG